MTPPRSSLEQRFDEILSRNRRRLCAVARAYSRTQSDDLLQEILLQIWRSLPRVREEAHVDTWCYRVALNTAISWLRTSGRRREMNLPLSEPNLVAGAVDDRDPWKLLQQFLPTLSETDRAIVLMYLDDLDSVQMAEVLGMTEGAIRVRIHRIKQKLSQWETDQP